MENICELDVALSFDLIGYRGQQASDNEHISFLIRREFCYRDDITQMKLPTSAPHRVLRNVAADRGLR
jgi:hypothetical protein